MFFLVRIFIQNEENSTNPSGSELRETHINNKCISLTCHIDMSGRSLKAVRFESQFPATRHNYRPLLSSLLLQDVLCVGLSESQFWRDYMRQCCWMVSSSFLLRNGASALSTSLALGKRPVDTISSTCTRTGSVLVFVRISLQLTGKTPR